MLKTHKINFSDITIANELANGYEYDRCKNALWSIHNVLKIMIEASAPAQAFWVLDGMGRHGEFVDDSMNSLVFTGIKDENKGGFASPKNFSLMDKYGFAISDILYTKKEKPFEKLSLSDIKQVTLSYIGDDFYDVMLGLKLIAVANAQHSWDFFGNADIRVAFKNATELGLPLGDLNKDKRKVEEFCDYYLVDDALQRGVNSLFALADKYKLKNRSNAGNSFMYKYRGKEVFELRVIHVNRLRIGLSPGRFVDGETMLHTLPKPLITEYLANSNISCGVCKGSSVCGHCLDLKFDDKEYQLCTCNIGCHFNNPSAEQFAMIEQFIHARIAAIDAVKSKQ